MKSRTTVVVIGGGIAGCSTLYHLTREGWTDVVLVERDELTSGTTWHSAAQVTNFGMNQTMVGLKRHSITLYRELAADPDYPVGYHYGDGGIRLAGESRQMEGYRHFASLARGMGVDFEIIDAAECARRHPLIATDGLLGGLWDPTDGDIDPAQLCQALARRARRAGAEIHRQTPVISLTQRADDSWIVHTTKGDIDCDVVVNAGGYRVNEIAAMMGVQHPVVSMEHQYFLTDPIASLSARDRRVPLLRCPISDFYSRQEKDGLLIGFYEQDCRTWGLDGIDPDFSNALCPDDLDRVTDVLEGVFERMPVLMDVGIRSIVNGPITYTMDGVPLVGPVPGRRNAYCIVGLRAGLGEGGGHGWLLAEQVVHGEASLDTWVLDPRRFGAYATVELCALKAIEDYRNEFRFHYPHEHRPAGRPIRTTPLTPLLAAEGAAFSVVNGWERLDYLKPASTFRETHGFQFNECHDVVGEEVRSVRDGVGLTELSGFNRIEIRGRHVGAWLDGLVCGRAPGRPGRVGLVYLLNRHGMVKAEATLARLDDETIWYGSAAAAETHDFEWLHRRLPADGSLTLRSLAASWTTLVIAGPFARDVLDAVSRDDWNPASFPWLSVRRACVGIAPVVVMSVSYSGELAYEIHVPSSHAQAAWQALRTAGKPHGIRLFGGRAIESMRIEKGFRHWKADLTTEYDPFESNLERFVDLDKPDFIGKAALQARQRRGPRRRFVSIAIDCDHAPAQPGDSILDQGRIVGTVTSAAWGHRVNRNLCLAFVDPECADTGRSLAVDVIGEPVPAAIIPHGPYDPTHRRMRG